MASQNSFQVVPISTILVDETIQPRLDGLDGSHVRLLEQVVDDFAPLTVVRRGDKHLLLDGRHRLAALQNQGRDVATVRVMEVSPQSDLRSLAFDLNATHGRPLSLDDRRAEAGRILHFNSATSDREIARHCGLSQPTVARIRAELEASAQIERTTERVGKGGYRYEVGPSKDVDETTRRAKSFERFIRYVQDAVRSNWWDPNVFVQLLLDSYGKEDHADILEALREIANSLVSLADLFESSI